MKRPVRSRRRELARTRPTVTRRTWASLAGVAVVGVALSAAVLSGGPQAWATPVLSGGRVPLSVLALAVVVALVALVLVALAARRRRARLGVTLDWIQDYEVTAETLADNPELDRRTAGAESLALRTLRAQVRTLEQALEQEQARPDATLTAPAAAEVVDFRRDVTLTLRALARRTADGEDPRRSLARAAAAVDRLVAPETFARPVLSPAPPLALSAGGRSASWGGGLVAPTPALVVSPAVQAAPTVTHAPAPTTVTHAPVPAAHQPMAPAGQDDTVAGFAPVEQDLTAELPAMPVTAGAVTGADDSADAEPREEVVLPVPPPRNDNPQRGRRWLRRGAA